MALLTSELTELRVALGYNALGVNAEPYVEYHAIFDRVVSEYLQAGATTTSSTTVTASTNGATSPVTLTLTSATGFTAGDRVVVDVDARQEEATIQNVSGSTITALLKLAHTGTYPVTVDGGETIVRRLLRRIRAVQDQLASSSTLKSAGSGGLAQVDEIKWHASGALGWSSTPMGSLSKELMRLRDELASALGVQNLFRVRRGYGLTMTMY